MKIAIMQPYFFPYIGYFQLMNEVDEFVVYDNIQHTKKGWINRNRILTNGRDEFISLPLKKASDFLDVRERQLADSWKDDKVKMLNKISASYRKAPQFKSVFPLIETCLLTEEINLFNFIANSIQRIKKFLEIETPVIISSGIAIDHSLKAEQKVLAICHAQKASHYLNPIGGLEMYDKEQFLQSGITLNFIKANNVRYSQLGAEFVPYLSILDVLMFNEKALVKQMLKTEFTIV